MANPAPGYAKKPEHRVDLLPETRRVRVVFNGTVIADSTASLRCEETGHDPVHYIPEKDIRLDLLRPTDHGFDDIQQRSRLNKGSHDTEKCRENECRWHPAANLSDEPGADAEGDHADNNRQRSGGIQIRRRNQSIRSDGRDAGKRERETSSAPSSPAPRAERIDGQEPGSKTRIHYDV